MYSPIRTPLHYAAATAQYQCVLSLVANGANLITVDNLKRTPLHYAAASDADGKYVQSIYMYLFYETILYMYMNL